MLFTQFNSLKCLFPMHSQIPVYSDKPWMTLFLICQVLLTF